MATAIVYYSLSGNTKTVAELVGEKTDGTLIRLEEDTSRKGFLGFVKSGFQAATRRMSNIRGEPWKTAAPFETVYLLTPIWAANGTPAMNAFLENADFQGKTVVIVTLQADPNGTGSEKTIDHMRAVVESRGGSVASSHPLHSAPPGKYAGEDHLRDQTQKLL
jgi:hypothetical protein